MISQYATLNTAPNWTLVSSEILTANEGRLVRRTVYSNGSLETRVHIEPVLSDDRPGTDPEGNSPRYRAVFGSEQELENPRAADPLQDGARQP